MPHHRCRGSIADGAERGAGVEHGRRRGGPAAEVADFRDPDRPRTPGRAAAHGHGLGRLRPAAARDVRQRARAQPVPGAPGAARGAAGRRPRLLRRLWGAGGREGARAADPAPDDRRGLDLDARRAVRGERAVDLPARVRAGDRPRGRQPAAALVPAAADRRLAPRVLRHRVPARGARRRGHQRAPAGHPPRRHGHPQAGAVGAAARRPHRRRRLLDGRRPLRLRVRPDPARSGLAGRQWAGMDLQTRHRAAADVAALPAGQPGVPEPGARAGARPRLGRRSRVWRWFVAAVPAILALRIARYAGVTGGAALPDVLRILAVCFALFGITGFGLTRLALPDALRRYEWLWVLPVGAVATAFAMTPLGFAHVPFAVNLALVIAGGVVLSAYALRTRGLPPRGRIAWPTYLAVLLLLVALVPLFRAGFLTVIGNGSD